VIDPEGDKGMHPHTSKYRLAQPDWQTLKLKISDLSIKKYKKFMA